MTDIPITNGELAKVIISTSDDQFVEQTGITRDQAARAASAVLMTIGAVMPTGATMPQQLSTVLNVIGMVSAEVIASAGRTPAERDNLRSSLTTFILQTSEELAEHVAKMRNFGNFVAQTAEGGQIVDGEAVAVN